MLLPDDIDAPPFTDDDLDAWFEFMDDAAIFFENAEEADVSNEPPSVLRVAAWAVRDTGSAEYAMRKLAHAQHQITETMEAAERFIDQIRRWESEQLRRPERAVNFFTGQLVTYARRKRKEDGVKTLKLPSGQVPSRLNPARPDIPKETKAEFVEWAKARELPVVKATWSPVMDEVKKHVVFQKVVVVKDVPAGQQVHSVRGHLFVLPDGLTSDQVNDALATLDGAILFDPDYVADLTDPDFGTYEERPSTAIYRREDGSWWLVPGVVEVPAEVTYSVRPSLP